MQKILIASPVRGGVPLPFLDSLTTILFAKWDGKYLMNYAHTSGTSVAMARDELANVAIQGGYDKMVFWDVDLSAKDRRLTLSMLDRLLSHDMDIVGGQYCGHNFQSQFHGAAVEGQQTMENGLLEMAQIPLGFSAIKVSALRTIREKMPWRTYATKQTQDEHCRPGMFEFFPNGVVGPCTAEGKLQRLKELLADYKKHATNFAERLDEVHSIVHDDKYESSFMLGEDFYFCKLARECGLKLYIDNNLIIPHESHVRLPVNNSDLLKAITEPWRWSDQAKESEIHHLVAGLRTKLAGDHA